MVSLVAPKLTGPGFVIGHAVTAAVCTWSPQLLEKCRTPAVASRCSTRFGVILPKLVQQLWRRRPAAVTVETPSPGDASAALGFRIQDSTLISLFCCISSAITFLQHFDGSTPKLKRCNRVIQCSDFWLAHPGRLPNDISIIVSRSEIWSPRLSLILFI